MSKGASRGERERDGIETSGEVFAAFFVVEREGYLFFEPGGRPRRLPLGFSMLRSLSTDFNSRSEVDGLERVRGCVGDCVGFAFSF